MSMGIYKPGQGYWVRMMTAIAVGILFLAGAAWVWQSVERISPPLKGYNVLVDSVQGGAPAPGTSIEFVGHEGDTAIATGVVRQADEGTSGLTLYIERIQRTPDAVTAERELTSAASIRIPAGAADRFSGQIAPDGAWRPVAAFEMTYFQTAAAAIVVLVGAVVIFLYVGKRPKSVDFLVATDNETRKVNWSTRKEVVGSTWVVIGATFLIAGALFVVDLLFQGFFSSIDVLQR
ncbi:MAG: preprotein translocase subunit SecE [Phycisphaerales bacterium]|nr:preprotein translocase subunit SecE [Phycisphaerales bacterium]MCB9840603.1 preprotein translocase subunit SecE [Phycisphaeraceae bacterium]